MPNRHGPYLVEALEENREDDVYGTTVYVISCLLEDALGERLSGLMSIREFDNLEALANTLKALDHKVDIQPEVRR